MAVSQNQVNLDIIFGDQRNAPDVKLVSDFLIGQQDLGKNLIAVF